MSSASRVLGPRTDDPGRDTFQGEHRITIRDRALSRCEEIIDLVAQEFGLMRSAIVGRRRFARLAWARQCAMSLCIEFTGLDARTVAEVFNRADDGIIYYSCACVKNADANRAAQVAALRTLIQPSYNHHTTVIQPSHNRHTTITQP